MSSIPLQSLDMHSAPGAGTLDKSDGHEAESPLRVERDAAGNEWTIPPHGGRLKRGGDHNRPGRPKEEAKEQFALNALVSARRDAKVLADLNLPDGDPAVEKAKDRAMKAIPEETVQLKDPHFFRNLAQACAVAGIDAETTVRLTDALTELSGVKE